jgi:Ala-tRNA(Pro) deacylase
MPIVVSSRSHAGSVQTRHRARNRTTLPVLRSIIPRSASVAAIRYGRPGQKAKPMTIAPKLRHYLDALELDYELMEHSPTKSAIQNALVCQIPPERIAKAVLIDTSDDYVLAVLPSDCRIELGELKNLLGAKPRLAREDEVASIFDDCAVGAVPPLGFTYGIRMIVDDSLENEPDVYFEAGDHQSLVHMDQAEFARMTSAARHCHFSQPWGMA